MNHILSKKINILMQRKPIPIKNNMANTLNSYFKDFSKRAISSFRISISPLKDLLSISSSSARTNIKRFINALACSSDIPVSRNASYLLKNSAEGIIYYPHGKYCLKQALIMAKPQTPKTQSIKLTFIFNEDIEALTSSLMVSFKTDSNELNLLVNTDSNLANLSSKDFSDIAKRSLKYFSDISKRALKYFSDPSIISLIDFSSLLKSSFVAKELSHALAFSTAIIYLPLRLFGYIRPIISRICNRSIPKFTIMTHTRLMDMQGAHGWH